MPPFVPTFGCPAPTFIIATSLSVPLTTELRSSRAESSSRWASSACAPSSSGRAITNAARPKRSGGAPAGRGRLRRSSISAAVSSSGRPLMKNTSASFAARARAGSDSPPK